MPVSRSDPFCDHVCDLLAPLGNIRARAMFSGRGIYLDDQMIALIIAETLYLKTDARNAPRFEAAGLEPFVYQSARGPTATSYRRAPDAGLDDGELLREWARGAIDAARAAKARRSSRPASTRAPKRTRG